jgi:transcriptional regulator with XRE-family HTH domain
VPRPATKPPDPFLKKLGARIRKQREAHGLSQEAFADACGLDRSYMSGIERGVRNISVLRLVAIAKTLKVGPGSLLQSE